MSEKGSGGGGRRGGRRVEGRYRTMMAVTVAAATDATTDGFRRIGTSWRSHTHSWDPILASK